MDDDCQVVANENNREIVQTIEDDDPLIAEIDIHLTRIFADQLYLFQYPLRSNRLQFENDIRFIGARLKPKNKLVQLDYAFDRQSRFHCTDHENRIAKNWHTKSDDSNIHRKITSIDRLTLTSTNATLGDDYKRFAVGILTSDGLQLSPLNAIFQMRPDFDVTSSVLAQHSAILAQQSIVTSDDDDDDDNEILTNNLLKQSLSSNTDDSTTDDDNHNINHQKPTGELVTMRFWRPEARFQREKKMRSYNYLERARNEERWIDLAYFAPNELPAIELRDQWTALNSNGKNRVPIRWRKTVSIQDYFAALFLDKKLFLQEPTDLECAAATALPATNMIEQKPLIIPPTRPKKKKKIDLDASTKSDKTTKKTSRKSRSANQKSTDSSISIASEQQQTTSSPLSSVSLPNTIIKQDPETIQNELLSFMKRRFGYRPYFKLSEINIAIKLELISSPPGHPLASGVTEASILRAAAEIGAIHVNKKWPKNLKQEPVFINAQMGDKYDVLRRYVADLLEKCDHFQFTELRSRIKQENQTQQFPVHEVKKFVKDHCITRSSRKGVLYCVKGTLVK